MARRRRRGEGSVFYSKSEKTWIARVSLGIVNGKRVGHKARARTEAGAKRELERLLRAYVSDTDPAIETLDEYLRHWLESHRRVRPSTLRSYREHVETHISPLLGGIPVAKLRQRDVERLVVELERKQGRHGRPLSPATIHRVIATLRVALNRGVKRGELPMNVAAYVELPRVERRQVHAMTDDEADAIVDAFRDHWAGPVVRLLAGSGMRLGEAVALNQGDVQEGFVRLRRSKTSLRAVPISEDAQAAIEEAIRAAPRQGRDEPLFFSPRIVRTGDSRGVRDRLRADSVTAVFPRVLATAGLERLTPHGLRHGAASLMVAKGVPMRAIADQLGHRNPAMTAQVYAHVQPEMQVRAVGLLNRRVKA